MAKGAPDHHLPTEPLLIDLKDSMVDVKNAVNNLKITLTNLNIMPPVAETPWAFKLIGKTKFIVHREITILPTVRYTIMDITGSGQTQGMMMELICADIWGNSKTTFTITLDGDVIFNAYPFWLFNDLADGESADYKLWGAEKNADPWYRWFFNIPIMYSASLKMEIKNESISDSTDMNCFIAYTNLP